TDATVGVVTDNAPANGDFVFQLATNIQLRDDLVDGSPPCNAQQFQGTTIAASWANVGSYAPTTSLFGGDLPSYPKDTIAQLKFPTSVVTFYAYIAERQANNTDEVGHVDPQTAAHDDVVLPNLPTTLALCPGS